LQCLSRRGVAVVRGPYPTVEMRDALAASYTSYHRFDWSGDRYQRTATRLAHRIDDFECLSAHDCDAAARQALQRNDTDRAVKIWQQVHRIDWI
jgi:hypothetical protein